SIPIKVMGWEEYIVPLPNTTDDYFGIAISGNNQSGSYGHIDDIYYEDLWPCMSPGNVQVDPLTVTTTGATISWDDSLDPGATGYEYEVRDSSGTVVDSGTTTAPVTTATATGLDPGTKYYVYIRSICGTTEGEWTLSPVEFMTNCDVFPGNFFEGFENTPQGGYNNHTYPDCWTYINTRANPNYRAAYGYQYAAKSGNNGYYVYHDYYNINSNADFMLISPETNNLGNGTKQVRFSVNHQYGYNGTMLIEVYSMDD